ncbi:ribonuclease R [Ruminococcaceae bacterium OttesenSCG-928-A16]|nr:ribonuclease R [Ruminococcaceae bacterium OttesenSCG-928-A16]
MSLRSVILRELSAGPRSAKMLRKTLAADERKVTRTLKALMRDNKVIGVNGMYRLRPQAAIKLKARPVGQTTGQQIPATLVKLGKSFGFAAPKDQSADIFVPGHALMGTLPGDEVQVELYTHPRVPGSREGSVVAISHYNNRLVGTIEKINGKLVLLPDGFVDTPILITKNGANGAKTGEKVAAEVITRGTSHQDHRAEVTLRFGPADLAKDCAEAIVYAAGIEKEFPPQVLKEAEYLAGQAVEENEIKSREDLRKEIIFTIDSASTKDIDDAISAQKTAKGYTLGVHIADVSHFVRPKSPLDEDAMGRGTSVYYANSVVPMLPKQLSNGICSLNPGEERLAFSCVMQLDKDARLVDYTFKKSVICSRIKGVYSEINALMEEQAEPETVDKYAEVTPTLLIMQEIYHKLAALRAARGNLEIESEEAAIQVDEEGRCIGVAHRTRGMAEHMIEEFMLQANQAAAMQAKQLGLPFVYRVHEKPATEKVEQLKLILRAAGISANFVAEVPTQAELGKILDETRGTPLERFVHVGVLRSMAKAKYEPTPKGHYGLALQDYAHFTSPIRRYPDLAIHRILSDVAAGKSVQEIKKKYTAFAEAASAISSEKELVAQRVERDCDDCYKAEYMTQFIGEQFTGVISSVVQFGIYVELENSIEGMVHVSKLSADHVDLVDGISLVDPLTGKTYKIGDTVTIEVENTNVSRGIIDFDIVE